MKKLEKTRIIRAADYLPKPKEDSGDLESFALPASDTILFGLFGDTPEYSNPKIEEIWETVIDAEDDEETIAYCLAQGVDVIGEGGEPVSGWRDIAVMLKAIEKGYVKLDIKGGGERQ